ncbi:MAG: hypothetical protein KDA62_19150 [Planctomycetales bacterium]|nr:hypothetical protein [Planctomycetales bacterium]
MNDSDDLIDAMAPVVAAFQKLGIRHYVGGSIASSFHGATRSTMDVDLVAELDEKSVSGFIDCFGNEFYLSESAIRDAVRRKACFNLIHLPSSFKVDIFISRERPFDEESMSRATLETLGEAKSVRVPVATAEDMIISKLEWFRLTNETSERQWDDVSRLLKLLGDAADIPYLRRAANSVKVEDLLERMFAELQG